MSSISESDLFAEIAALHAAASDPLAVAETYGKRVQQLYWETRDLPAMIGVGLAGIQYGLRAADIATDAETAASLKGAAKGIAYNIGSFCWPGWDEPGIAVDETALTLGRHAAHLNLRLGVELGRGDLPISRAHWLVGAHLLAAREYETATQSFDEAARHANAAGAAAEEQLAIGFSLLTRCLANSEDASVRERLDGVRADLAASEGGAGFVQQIDTADQVFRAQPPVKP